MKPNAKTVFFSKLFFYLVSRSAKLNTSDSDDRDEAVVLHEVELSSRNMTKISAKHISEVQYFNKVAWMQSVA